jgi:hypothetical protein
MPIRIHVLEVVEHEIREPGNLKEGLPRGQAAGIDGGVEATTAALSKAVDQKPGLSQRLAAREGHAAARRLEEDPVPLQDVNELTDVEFAPGELARVCRAGLNA